MNISKSDSLKVEIKHDKGKDNCNSIILIVIF